MCVDALEVKQVVGWLREPSKQQHAKQTCHLLNHALNMSHTHRCSAAVIQPNAMRVFNLEVTTLPS